MRHDADLFAAREDAPSLGYLYLLEAKSFIARRSRVVVMNTACRRSREPLASRTMELPPDKAVLLQDALGRITRAESPRVAKSDRARQTAGLALRRA